MENHIKLNFTFIKHNSDYLTEIDDQTISSILDNSQLSINELLVTIARDLKYHPWVFENWDRMIDYLSTNYEGDAIHENIAIIHIKFPNNIQFKDLKKSGFEKLG